MGSIGLLDGGQDDRKSGMGIVPKLFESQDFSSHACVQLLEKNPYQNMTDDDWALRTWMVPHSVIRLSTKYLIAGLDGINKCVATARNLNSIITTTGQTLTEEEHCQDLEKRAEVMHRWYRFSLPILYL